MRKLRENGILFAAVFFAIILFLGWQADVNLFEYKVNGKSEANYEYIGNDAADLQTEYSANFPYKTNFVDINGFGRRMTGQREMNGVLKLNNGYLTEVCDRMNADCIEANARAIIDFNAYCIAHGTILVYVQPAYKISKYDLQLPMGVTDGHNDTMDALLRLLSDAGVPVMDLRELMHDEGINQYDLYYRTDHHWTTEGAFYAYTKIAPWIAAKTDAESDDSLMHLENYQIDNYSGWHLGMRGQRTGSAFAGIDDYHLIYQKFETYIRRRSDDTITSLKDALVRQDLFVKKDARNRYTYDSAYTANDINNLESLDAKTDLCVWLLSDSFQQGINPYFLLTYREFHAGGYETLSTAFVQNNNPDVIIILPWPGYF